MLKLKLTAFCSKGISAIKEMDLFFKNIVPGNIYFRSTVSCLVLQITFYRSNIGSVLK